MGSCLRSGNCCTNFGVCVTSFDIVRLIKTTSMAPVNFITTIPEQQDRERNEPAVLIDQELVLIILQWKKERVCKFYSGSTCTVYTGRPMLCRSYPFYLKDNKFVEIRSRACPERWMPDGDEKEQYLSDLQRYRKEVDNYKKIVAKWNANGGGSLNNFLRYAINETEKLLK